MSALPCNVDLGENDDTELLLLLDDIEAEEKELEGQIASGNRAIALVGRRYRSEACLRPCS